MKTNKKDRISYIDQISGVLIVYMVIYHIFQFSGLNNYLHSFFMHSLSFFMFWFFYKSGMFYHDRTSKEILLGGGKKLLIPFLIFSFLGHLVLCIQMWQDAISDWRQYLLDPIISTVIVGSSSGNTPLWFLPSLLAVQWLYSIAYKRISDNWILIISILGAYLLFRYNIHKPLYIGNILLGLATYSIGHQLKSLQFKNTVIVLSSFAYVAIFLIQDEAIDFRMNELARGSYLLSVIFAISGCVLINFLFHKLSTSISLLEYIGRRSMSFYVMHWIVLVACTIVCEYDGWRLFTTMLIANVIVLPIAEKLIHSYHFDWVFGIKTS